MTAAKPPGIRRGQMVALAASIVLLYTWVLLPDVLLPDSFVILASREDGLVESLGALSLLMAGALFFLCFLSARRARCERVTQLFLLGLAVAFIVGAGEEVSWGQRVVGYEPPTVVKENNYQHELNLHNFDEVGYWGVWRAFKVFTLLFVVALPLIAWRNPRARGFLSRYVPIVPLAFGGLFLLVEVMNALATYVYPNEWVLPDGSWNDVMFPTSGPWESDSTSETAYSLLWAVVSFNLLRAAEVTREHTRERRKGKYKLRGARGQGAPRDRAPAHARR